MMRTVIKLLKEIDRKLDLIIEALHVKDAGIL